MAFFEVFQALAALDIGFFIDLFIKNLFWFFIIYTLIHFFFNGKKTLYFTAFLFLVLFALVDLEVSAGLVFTSASFLILYYISKLAILAMVENTPRLQKYVVIASTLQAYVLLLFFTFFLK